MAELANPLLFLNLSCQMLFVLDERLRSQPAAADRVIAVLGDIIDGMFGATWIDSLFKPKSLPLLPTVYATFSDFAHSSMMTLSATSMERLFDLMCGGVKLMICSSTNARDVITGTVAHLDGVVQLLRQVPHSNRGTEQRRVEALQLVEASKARVISTYNGSEWSDFHVTMLRTELLNFFKNCRVKVSVFLHEGVQDDHAQMFLRKPQRKEGGPVGRVKFEHTGETKDVRLAFMDESDNEWFCHPMRLGENLFRTDRLRVLPPPRRGVNPREDRFSGDPLRSEPTPRNGEGRSESGQLNNKLQASVMSSENNGDSLIKSEARILASFSSSKATCELPMLDIFLPDDSTNSVKCKRQSEERLAQMQDSGHETYKLQLGSVVSNIDGARGAEESAPISLLSLMDEQSDGE